MGFYDDQNGAGLNNSGGNFYDTGSASSGPAMQQAETFTEDLTKAATKPVRPPKKKREYKAAKFIGKTVAAALIFCVVASAGFYGINQIFHIIPVNTVSIDSVSTTTAQDKEAPYSRTQNTGKVDDVSQIVENVMPSIVKVTNVSVVRYQGFFGQVFEQEFPSAGSGFIIGKDDNYVYVATNNHVVLDSKDTTVTFHDEEPVSGEIQGMYQDKDVAVIRVAIKDIPEETLSTIKVSSIGDSDTLSVGQGAIVIGNSLGYGFSVSTGVISALDREFSAKDQSGYVITNNLIQTDAAINEGNSGGPLLNMNGEVVGIVSSKYMSTGVEGMGYAIPINQAQKIIEGLIETGSYSPEPEEGDAQLVNRAYLGVYGGMDIDEEISLQYGIPKGVYVQSVVEGSPAESTGMTKGDIITGFEGKPVTTMSELVEAVGKHEPGDKVQVTFAIAAGNYIEKTAQVTLVERPAE